MHTLPEVTFPVLSAPLPAPEPSVTVRVVVIQNGQILLVHELGERGRHGKPSGHGIPGGGVSGSVSAMRAQVERFLPVYRIGEATSDAVSQLLRDLDFQCTLVGDTIPATVFWTAIKEGIEETGLLLVPFDAFTFADDGDHRRVIVRATVAGGTIAPRSMETDWCGWVPLEQLPPDMYRSHRTMIRMVIGRYGTREV